MVGKWKRIVDIATSKGLKGGCKSTGLEGQVSGRECSSAQFPNSIFERKPLCVFSLLLHFYLYLLFPSPHLLLQSSFLQLPHKKGFWKSSLLFLVSSILLLSAVYFLFSSFPIILRRTRKLSIGESVRFLFLSFSLFHWANANVFHAKTYTKC